MNQIIFVAIGIVVCFVVGGAWYWLAYQRAFNKRAQDIQDDISLRKIKVSNLLQPVIDAQIEYLEKIKIESFATPDQDKFDPNLSFKNIRDSYKMNSSSVKTSGSDAGLYIHSAFTNYNAVSDDFINAVSHMANQHFEKGMELSAYLKSLSTDHSWSSLFSSMPKATLHNLQGHFGERVIGNALSDAGNEVIFPESGSQPGWDLLVNGHEVQIKTVSSYQHVLNHLEKHPDIPVMVNGDASGIPDLTPHIDIDNIQDLANFDFDSASVIAIDGISADGAYESVHEGVDGSTGGVDAHIPWITVCFSVYREVNLLNSSYTDLQTSAKNIALDAAGAGVGAFAGAKAGAAIGMLGGPAGIAIGGAFGAVIGAIGGRAISNSIKSHDAEEADIKLQIALAELPVKISNKFNQLRDSVKSNLTAANNDFQIVQSSTQEEFNRHHKNAKVNRSVLEKRVCENLLKVSEFTCNDKLSKAQLVISMNPKIRGQRDADLIHLQKQKELLMVYDNDQVKCLELACVLDVPFEVIVETCTHYVNSLTSINLSLAKTTKILSQNLFAKALKISEKLKKETEAFKENTSVEIVKNFSSVKNCLDHSTNEWRKLGQEKHAKSIQDLAEQLRVTKEKLVKEIKGDQKNAA